MIQVNGKPQYLTLAAKQSDNGGITAYASVFDVRSEQGIIIKKGAFAPYLHQLEERGYLLWQHDLNQLVGMITQAAEDDVGLLINAEWHTTPEAQARRTIVTERLERGLFVGVSIGFYPTRYDYQDNGETLVVTEADIRECSIVLFPDNPLARVLVAQSMQQQLHNAADIATEAVAAIERCAERVAELRKLRAEKGKKVSAKTIDEIKSLSQQLSRIASAASSLVDDVDNVVASCCAVDAERQRLKAIVQHLTQETDEPPRNQQPTRGSPQAGAVPT
ncbi:MAG: hypothetical protein KatS3mg038_1205 [Candidatus Kapaibacterium sp.]|nr:MAG: hypothetical protein KatS3mg038_1164 [Candidatus Kapabacteria bacterium]GIV50684.1 MAG: hypothetical protein KatS3mg038_1205 [Candidatus Kapabacteria bacterium]